MYETSIGVVEDRSGHRRHTAAAQHLDSEVEPRRLLGDAGRDALAPTAIVRLLLESESCLFAAQGRF